MSPVRRGLTLVELLVVITILTLVTAAAVPLIAPATQQRKIREAARILSDVFAGAQARAVAAGRPVGVWLQRIGDRPRANRVQANTAIDLFYCQVPPPYTGDTTNAVCLPNPNQNSQSQFRILFPPHLTQPIPPQTVRVGDRIRLNYRGPLYTILGGQNTSNDGWISGNLLQVEEPLPSGGTPMPVPFQIYRQPVKSADKPVQLPIGVHVDLASSGSANNTAFAAPNAPVCTNRVLVMFNAAGGIDSVYFDTLIRGQAVFTVAQPTAPLFFLIAKTIDPGAQAANTSVASFQDLENQWVAINPLTGLCTTSEVANPNSRFSPNGTIPVPTLRESRAYARTAQNIGGR